MSYLRRNREKDRQEDKRRCYLWVIAVVLPLLAIAVIPLNLLVLEMPEWISIVFVCLIIGANIFLWTKLHKKYVRKIILSLFGVIAVVVSWFGTYCNPYWNSISFRNVDEYTDYDAVLTYRQAKKDLDYAFHYLEKLHPACYHGTPAELEAQYALAVEHLQSADSIDVAMLAGEIEGILSLLHDAHTGIGKNYANPRYMKYIEAHSQAGNVLIAVNGMSFSDMLDRYSDKISYEADTYGIQRLGGYVNTAEGLSYLGISVENGVHYTYETPDGNTVEQFVRAEDFLVWDEYVAYNNIGEDTQEISFVSYEIDREHDLAVLALTSCVYNEEYQTCVREMFTEVKEQGIHNVAVDLRDNGGGNSLVANEFLRYIDVDDYKEWASDWRLGCLLFENEQSVRQNDKYEELLFHGNLYLLTSVSTFSAAMDFAEYVKDNQIGTIIGEASGNAPDSYGDVSVFLLPESGILMQISTKKWYRIDNIEGLIEPDIPCGRDEVWEQLYEQCVQ